MTEIIIPQQPGGGIVHFSKEQVALIKRTICKPKDREATNDELALFVGQCKRTGLDPFAKQIYAIFRKNKDGTEGMTIQTAIDGFRLIAERTGKYAGKKGTWWCGADGEWKDVWLNEGKPAAAKVTVRKMLDSGVVVEIPAVAHWGEYKPKYGAGPMWENMPANQLAKCAEALALRQAFPNDLSGLYTFDEMDQAPVPPSLTSSGEIVDEPNVELTPEIEAIIARAEDLGATAWANRGTWKYRISMGEQTLRSELAQAKIQLDALEAQGKITEAEVVEKHEWQLQDLEASEESLGGGDIPPTDETDPYLSSSDGITEGSVENESVAQEVSPVDTSTAPPTITYSRSSRGSQSHQASADAGKSKAMQQLLIKKQYIESMSTEEGDEEEEAQKAEALAMVDKQINALEAKEAQGSLL